jgi:hypothetical protein
MMRHSMVTLRDKQENIGAILLLHGTTENYINAVYLPHLVAERRTWGIGTPMQVRRGHS